MLNADLIVSACASMTFVCVVQMIFTSYSKTPGTIQMSRAQKQAYPPGMQFASTPNGSASPSTLDELIQHLVAEIGDVEDKPGKRIVIKLDGGPAVPKNNPLWLSKLARQGVILFPGVPNASSVNQVGLGLMTCGSISNTALHCQNTCVQELDQAFNYHKQLLANGRKKVKERFDRECNAKVAEAVARGDDSVDFAPLRQPSFTNRKVLGELMTFAEKVWCFCNACGPF